MGCSEYNSCPADTVLVRNADQLQGEDTETCCARLCSGFQCPAPLRLISDAAMVAGDDASTCCREAVDCSVLEGSDFSQRDCSESLGDWAGAGTCVSYVRTGGKSCNTFCAASGMQCLKANDDTGGSCGVRGYGKCSDSYGDQICVCGEAAAPQAS